MMYKLVLVTAVLVAATCALPTGSIESPEPVQYYSRPQVALFENSAKLPTAAGSAINTYLDLYWQGMSLVQASSIQSTALVHPTIMVPPNTLPNGAFYYHYNPVTMEQGRPAMTTAYNGSTIDHFDLNSFYYGCTVAKQASVAEAPQSCIVTIKGFVGDGGERMVGQQSFRFAVQSTQTSMEMQKAAVSAQFKSMKKVYFSVTNDDTVAALIDTVSYTVYSTEKFLS